MNPSAPNRDHLPLLDVIRGAAVWLVFATHALGHSYQGHSEIPWIGWVRDVQGAGWFAAYTPLSMGWLGVAVFFAVSGFCIHLSHARSSSNGYREFFLKRACRLYPAYAFALITFAFFFPGFKLDLSKIGDQLQLWSHVALIHNLVGCFSGINAAFWSIAVEVQLYLLYIPFYWLARKRGWLQALLLAGLVEFGYRSLIAIWDVVGSSELPNTIRYFTLSFCWSWAIGAYAAENYIKGNVPRIKIFTLFLLGGAMIVAYFIKPLLIFAFPLASLLTVKLICRFSSKNHPTGMFGEVSRMTSWYGKISYSVYLIHGPILWLIAENLRRYSQFWVENPEVMFLFMLTVVWGGVCVISWMMYRWIEVPGIAWGRKLIEVTRNRKALTAVQGSAEAE